MLVLIDNGHGINTPGKCSPDKSLREYKYTREIAKMLESKLNENGIETFRVTHENDDVPLSERAARVNALCDKYGADNCCLVSIHCNACPPDDGKWHNARGWSAYTTKGRTGGDDLADKLYDAAKQCLGDYITKTFAPKDRHKAIRFDMGDGDCDFEENFAILRKTRCAAVLTENLFQDNRDDVDFLLSDEGRKAIVDIHFNGIVQYIKSKV